jgi:hypothetical protein
MHILNARHRSIVEKASILEQLPIAESREHFLKMLAQGAQQQMTPSTVISICSILASGQGLTSTYNRNANPLAEVKGHRWK